MEITENFETTLKIQKNGSGYATITKEAGGFRVRRHTVKPVNCGTYSFTIQESQIAATEAEARVIADEYAAINEPQRRERQRRDCHFCGLPLDRHGCCEECGEQFQIVF